MPRRFLFIFDDVSADDGFVGPDGFLLPQSSLGKACLPLLLLESRAV
jgi:hypothetical protein